MASLIDCGSNAVNQRCHNIVTNDNSTMKKLSLIICGDKLMNNHLIVGKLSSKFYKVLFKSIKKSYNVEMLSSLKSIGSNIREIEFIDCLFRKHKAFQNILRQFPKVEKITFKECSFRFSNQKSNPKVLFLENLTEIVFNEQNLTMLSYIGAQVESLKVNLQFMNDAHELLNEQSLMEFLYTQKDSVEILELGTFSNEVYELILNNFENIKTLRIDITAFPTDLSFYKRIKVIRTVTKLIVNGVIKDVIQYCTILSLFPNVTEISFACYIPFEVLSWLSNCCNALKSLSLYSLYRGNYRNVKFSALKNLHLERIGDENEWIDLVMSNQTIESLSCRRTFSMYEFDADKVFGPKLKMICEVLPNLKHLKLGDNIIVNLCHLQNIVEICKNLESMDVMGSGIDVGMMPMRKGFKLRCHDKSSIRFVFPTHEPVWKDDIEDEDT